MRGALSVPSASDSEERRAVGPVAPAISNRIQHFAVKTPSGEIVQRAAAELVAIPTLHAGALEDFLPAE
jgi:hypothetical protein